MKARLAQLHQSGATLGQRPEWTADGWAPTDDTGGSGAALGWFIVTDYGATGDGTTDDTAEINLAIADLNTAGRGVLYFPAGTYKITAALTTITAHAVIKGDGAGDIQAQNGASTIKTTSTTAHTMTLAGNGTVVEDIAFECSTLTTQTAGSAIHVTQGDRNDYRNVSVRGFYDNLNIEDGANWTMTGCYLVGPVRYGLYVRHVDLPDGGDQVVMGCNFYAEDRNATSAVRVESGGGFKMLGCKINTLQGTGKYSYGLDLAIGVDTSVLQVNGCSFENVLNSAIRVVTTGSGNYDLIVLAGVEIALYDSGSAPAIELTAASSGKISEVTLTGLALRAAPSRSVAAITMTNVVNAVIGDRVIDGFTTAYTETTCTGVIDGLGTGTAYTDEQARDAVAAMIAAGTHTGVTFAYNDGADSLSATVTVTASTGELLMQDGVTAPPVPIENEAQTDWLYAD